MHLPFNPVAALQLLDSPPMRGRALIASSLAIALIAFVDWKITPDLTLGSLYLFPILAIGVFAQRWQILVLSAVCAALREFLSPLAWDHDFVARMLMCFVAFVGAGLFVAELARNHRLAVDHTGELKRQAALREEVQEELRVLVESSPAAILTLDSEGRVLVANEAAARLLDFGGGPLRGQDMRPHLPALVSALEGPRSLVRTSMECVGKRRDGDVFLAHIWFSTYHTLAGVRLAAIVLDVSEHLRDREVAGLGSVAAASRILFGAVSHEVRNLAAAAAVAHANLARTPGLMLNDDFKALGALVEGLQRIASAELRLGSHLTIDSIDLSNVLDELRIVLEPTFRDDAMVVEWHVPATLPRVLADPHSLLQIFLNLAQNSQRAMASAGAPEPRLVVSATTEDACVVVRFEDAGPGVRSPEKLFQPFHQGGEASGLGLFISRTIARSFAGDVQHEPTSSGSCFAVRLASAVQKVVPA